MAGIAWLSLDLISTLLLTSNDYKVWDEITFLFPNVNGVTAELWDWIDSFTPHFTGYVITYPFWD